MLPVLFEGGSIAFAVLSYSQGWEEGIPGSVCKGVQYFVIASIFDRAVKYFLAPKASSEPTSLKDTLINPCIEEALYSGLFRTVHTGFAIPRFLAYSVVAATGARAFTGPPPSSENPPTSLSLDNKIGISCALVREIVVLTSSGPYISLFFLFSDCALFASSEIRPTKGVLSLPIGTPAHKQVSACILRATAYKWTSAFAFRAIAYYGLSRYGFATPLTQHLFFNFLKHVEHKAEKSA